MVRPLIAQTFPSVSYDDVQPYTVPSVTYEEPKDYSTGPLNDPIIFLIIAALVFAVFAYRSFMRKPRSQDKVASFAALTGASVGLAVFWPQFFGQSLPLAALSDIPQDRFWQVFQTPLIAAAVLGIAAFTAGVFVVSTANQEVPATPTNPIDDAKPRRPYPLKAGDRIKVYKGYEIYKAEDGAIVNGVNYPSLLAAEEAVNKLKKPLIKW